MIFRTGGANLLIPGVQVMQTGGGEFIGAYDAIPSITAAYGMRRLRSAYTGNCLRIRRNSDNTESDFGFDGAGDLDTTAITAFLAATTGYVTTWYDQSGNGYNAVQTMAANQPLYSAAGPTFDGTNDYLATTMLAVIPDWSVIVRYSDAILTGSRLLFGAQEIEDKRFTIRIRTDLRTYQQGGYTNVVIAAPVAAVIGFSDRQGYLNGVAEGAQIGAGINGPMTSTIDIGRATGALETGYYSGKMHEVVLSAISYTALQMASIASIMETAP